VLAGSVGAADERSRPSLRIGEWSVDRETNELRRGSEAVHIEPKAMDVLVLLAERVGRVVSREQLFAAVWPGVVVGDDALTQSIIKLRRVLGDDPRSPAYIETISKRGYRLIAPVVRQGEAPETAPRRLGVAGSPEPAPRLRRHGLETGLLAGVVLAMIAGAAYYYHTRLPEAPVETATDATNARPSDWVTVTVMPFESLGPDGDQAYLARGISDTLMTDLSRLSDLRVIQPSGAPTRAAAQHARYRVSGSVQRESGTLRINVHLTDTKTGEQLWSRRFEQPFSDLFTMQDEIIARLVEVLPAKISDVERRRLAKRYTSSLEAYDDFLRAQSLFLVRGDEENERARALYRKALELDPKFARAYAGLAMTYAMEYRLRPSAGTSALDRALELAETARAIDPDIPEVYWALGFVQTQGRRHDKAIEALERAIRLEPSFADGYALLGGIDTYVGQPAKSIPLLRTAMRLNPDGGYLYFLLLGRAYLFENDLEQALINLRAAVKGNPVDLESHLYLAAALVATGDESGAKWEADEIRSLESGFSARRWLETYPMTDVGQKARLVALLGKAGL